MIYIYDRNRRKIGILENASNIIIKEQINRMFYMEFDLPLADTKNELCKPFCFARYTEEGDLYRIMPSSMEKHEAGIVHYECEHAIATLIDRVLYGWHKVGNLGYYTRDCINYILSKQSDWKLGECEFNRQFQYGWEQESFLSALFSVATPLRNYIWHFDTSQYPWRVNLRQLGKSQESKDAIIFKKNLLRLKKRSDTNNLCTRLYPLGYGEGVNQLGIKEINGGRPYLQSPASIVAKYGIIERVWIDRRYEKAEELKAAAEKMLEELQEPLISYETEVAFLDANVGDLVRIIDTDTKTDHKAMIVSIERQYVDIPRMKIEIANKDVHIAQSLADIADRQRIEQAYAQGATQIYSQSLQANCSPTEGATISFYIPSEMRKINKVRAKIRLESFRAYSRATEGGGAYSSTTASGGGSYNSTSSGGGYHSTTAAGGSFNTTTAAGGGFHTTTASGGGDYGTTEDGGFYSSTTAAGGGFHTTTASGGGDYGTTEDGGAYSSTTAAGGGEYGTTGSGGGEYSITGGGGGVQSTTRSGEANVWIGAMSPSGPPYIDQTEMSGDPPHSHGIPTHTHYVDTPPHSHEFSIDEHTHSFAIDDHTHSITIDDHSHEFEIGPHAHTFTIDDHSHDLEIEDHEHEFVVQGHTHTFTIDDHTHSVTIDDHTHGMSIGDHKHDISIPDHTHNVTIDDHTHGISLPNHTHEISPGIYRFGYPRYFSLYVNGRFRATINGTDADLDITQYLIENGTIPRDSWIEVEIRPNDLSYAIIDLFVQGFIQSRGDRAI